MAVEFIPKEVISTTEKILNKKWPCTQGNTYLLIIIDASSENELDNLSETVADICMEKGGLNIYVADSPQKQEQVLSIRSKIYESLKEKNIETLDIVVPRAEIARHMEKILEVQQEFGMWLPTYGHAADGNVHTHIMSVQLKDGEFLPLPEKVWKKNLDKIRAELYRDCRDRGGVISGEHGIGLVKKKFLPYVLEEEELSLMRKIKKAFDPNNIMNPGKIFDM